MGVPYSYARIELVDGFYGFYGFSKSWLCDGYVVVTTGCCNSRAIFRLMS